ncbi:MAG: hypothetical protein HZA04_10155 [Nitrospinae bacterium]|nr:hypothetical protein [Nitrospinota bacterium]
MIEKIRTYWARLNKREKILTAGAMLSLVFYVTYTFMLEKTVSALLESSRTLSKSEAEYQKLLIYHQRLEQLQKEQKQLEASLVKKQEEERKFMEGLKARHHIDKLLMELQATARRMPMQLVELDVKTGVITRNKEYTLEKVQSMGGDASEGVKSVLAAAMGAKSGNEGQGTTQMVTVNYTQNSINLVFRSTYQSAVKYILKIVEMPYAISILSIEMHRGTTAENAKNISDKAMKQAALSGEILLDTKMELEVYYR